MLALLPVLTTWSALARAAGVPSAGTSTIPNGVLLVGSGPGGADPTGAFQVVVRDLQRNVVSGSLVILDLSGCWGQVRVGSTQPYPGMTVDCPTRTVRAITDGAGIARFDVVGWAGPRSVDLINAVFQADGITLGTRPVAALDLDGAGGLSSGDLSLWVGDYLSGQNPVRGDYDHSGSLGANDVAIWLGAFLAGGSPSSVPTCP